MPLSLLVLGDEDARAAVQGAEVITLDGCKLACATVNVQQAGGRWRRPTPCWTSTGITGSFKPQGIAELNEGGLALARALAEEVAAASDALTQEADDHA